MKVRLKYRKFKFIYAITLLAHHVCLLSFTVLCPEDTNLFLADFCQDSNASNKIIRSVNNIIRDKDLGRI